MARIGIYGGTFNPPHLGHMQAARQALECLQLDRLLLIPGGQPPHKELAQDSPTALQRTEMLQSMADALPRTQVLTLEIQRQGKSYTADTLRELAGRYPDDQLFFLMGTDMLLSFPNWYHPEEICRYATLALLAREEQDTALKEQLQAVTQVIETRLGGQVVRVRNQALPMSSTEVRRMIALGAGEEMLTPSIFSRIQQWGCYGVHRSRRGLSLAELESEVVKLLKPSRVAHVLGCRDTAVRLAGRYGQDVTEAARAALLHDVTKALPMAQQEMLCRRYQVQLPSWALQSPPTAHAFTGALAAEQVFGECPAVCQAIAYHTTGKPGMNILEQMIYIADYIEPTRDFPGVARLRETAERSLLDAVALGLEMTMTHLTEAGKTVAGISQEAYRWAVGQQKGL